jgi:hypothetical protein
VDARREKVRARHNGGGASHGRARLRLRREHCAPSWNCRGRRRDSRRSTTEFGTKRHENHRLPCRAAKYALLAAEEPMVCTTLRWREVDSKFRFLDLGRALLHRSGARSCKGLGSHSRVLTTDNGRFTVRRARLAPAMISTPGHRASRRRQREVLPAWRDFLGEQPEAAPIKPVFDAASAPCIFAARQGSRWVSNLFVPNSVVERPPIRNPFPSAAESPWISQTDAAVNRRSHGET